MTFDEISSVCGDGLIFFIQSALFLVTLPPFSCVCQCDRRTYPVKVIHLQANQRLNAVEVVGQIHQAHAHLGACGSNTAQEDAPHFIFHRDRLFRRCRMSILNMSTRQVGLRPAVLLRLAGAMHSSVGRNSSQSMTALRRSSGLPASERLRNGFEDQTDCFAWRVVDT